VPHRALYPEITPYSSGFINVGGHHELYWEQSGNPHGRPVILLHGGPGAGATPTHRRFFDPDHYRIVIFDQRGAGRSHPLGDLTDNTAQNLVEDIEKLRGHLGIQNWHVFGGSWGSTLALLYASQYPQHCLSLTLRGIFLCTRSEINWFTHGMGMIFPEAWQEFADFIPASERDDLLKAYANRLIHGDTETQYQAALYWTRLESTCATLLPSYKEPVTREDHDHLWSLARIEAHYFQNQFWDDIPSFLKQLEPIRAIPATIIHGRYDMICPIATANELHKFWPEADYIVVPDAGHSAMDPPLRSRLIETMEHYKSI
jgi:proline iminopeptidase